MPLFDIPSRRTKSADSAVLQKASKKKKAAPATKSGGGIASKISLIKANVEKYLGKYRDKYEVIRDEKRLEEYITNCIEYDYVAIDTETTGLDPITDKLVGVCIYAPNEKPAYVPVGHISYVTGFPSKNQLSVDFVSQQIQRLADAGTKIIMFNADFDIRVIRHSLNVFLECYWDCYLAARCLNENEPSNKLKKLHEKYVLKGEEDEFSFDELFKGLNFAYVPIDTAYLYAAHDGIVTFEYFDYQRKFLRLDSEREDMRNVAWVFFNIEMPCVNVVADMEDTGVAFDLKYAAELHTKYHKILDEKFNNFVKEYKMYGKEIEAYSGSTRLDDPININSVPQLQALLYDIIGLVGPIDKKTKKPSRGTGEDILKALKHPVAEAILEYREFSTIVSTFIDKLPECVYKQDGRIHCKFNQYGADTGRFSSSDPNLQNIPSHNKDIRKMFTASPGYVLLSADYSQQEVKGMAQMCGDEGMIEAFRQGKDFYAEIAAVAFGKAYEDCLEFRPDGTTNPEGKERRAQAKSILLGINYGRGAASIAEQLGCTKQKAEKIKEDVFKGFPAIEEFERQSFEMAEELGYVTTLWGRKRRLPVMQLPDYEFQWKEGAGLSDDPFNFDDEEVEDEVPDKLINKYLRKLSHVPFNKKRGVFEEANAEGIWIIDHTKERIDTTRQIVNSRIQGSAADQSKLAMIAIGNDARLKELGFRILIPVHDELIAECPKENVVECRERFKYLMEHSSGEKFTIPITVDVACFDRWYGEEIQF